MRPTTSLTVLSVFNLIVLFSYIAYDVWSARPRVVYIDSNILINGYKGMDKAKAEFNKKIAGWQVNLDTLQSELKSSIFKYEKESSTMSSKEKKLSEELLALKQKQFHDYREAITLQAQEEEAARTKEVVQRINSFIERYGAAKGYTIILAATEYGNMAYADKSLDITQDVLHQLNVEYDQTGR